MIFLNYCSTIKLSSISALYHQCPVCSNNNFPLSSSYSITIIFYYCYHTQSHTPPPTHPSSQDAEDALPGCHSSFFSFCILSKMKQEVPPRAWAGCCQAPAVLWLAGRATLQTRVTSSRGNRLCFMMLWTKTQLTISQLLCCHPRTPDPPTAECQEREILCVCACVIVRQPRNEWVILQKTYRKVNIYWRTWWIIIKR